jgi:hypothetical protein
MRRLNETPKSIYYPEGAAPYGELGLLRARRTASPRIRTMTSGAAGAVLLRAWTESDWLRAAMRNPLTDPSTQRQAQFAVSKSANNMSEAADRSTLYPKKAATWYAVDPTITRNPIGISYITQDVSGGAMQRLYKRLAAPQKEYVKVAADVMPDSQKKGLGVALLDAAFRTVRDPEQVPTTYAPEHNTSLIAKLGDLGFKSTGSHARTDLVEGLTIQEVRLAAPSVAHVQGTLHEMYPWLDNAQVLH